MFEILLWVILFVISLFVLVKGADYFTEAAEKIGLYFDIPPFIIGVTIVALGTSIPELASSIAAVFQNSTEIVVGNVMGSNIANILLIIGISSIFAKKLKSKWNLMNIDLPLLVGSVALLTLTIIDGTFSFYDALFCLVGYVIYLFYTLSVRKKHKKEENNAAKELFDLRKQKKFDWKLIFVLIVSCILIYFGARFTIVSLNKLAELFNIAKEIIAVVALAVGTSLPELVVSVTAAKKGKTEIAIGNVIGSNIFNTFIVMGIPGLFTTLVIPTSMINFVLPVMAGTTVFFFFITQDNEISRWEGGILILLYILFIIKLFGF